MQKMNEWSVKNPIAKQKLEAFGEFNYDEEANRGPEPVEKRPPFEFLRGPFKGNIWDGEWIVGKNIPLGKGRMHFHNGDIYEGWLKFDDDYDEETTFLSGKIRVFTYEGDVYEGQWHIDGHREGKGIFTWENGD